MPLAITVDQAKIVGRSSLVMYARILESGSFEFRWQDVAAGKSRTAVCGWMRDIEESGLARFRTLRGKGRIRMIVDHDYTGDAMLFIPRLNATAAGRHYRGHFGQDDYVILRHVRPEWDKDVYEQQLLVGIADAAGRDNPIDGQQLRRWLQTGLKMVKDTPAGQEMDPWQRLQAKGEM